MQDGPSRCACEIGGDPTNNKPPPTGLAETHRVRTSYSTGTVTRLGNNLGNNSGDLHQATQTGVTDDIGIH